MTRKKATLKDLNKMAAKGEIATAQNASAEFNVPDEFWENASPVVLPPQKVSVHLRIDTDVFDWFRAKGPGHLTRMNAVLRSYYETMRGDKQENEESN